MMATFMQLALVVDMEVVPNKVSRYVLVCGRTASVIGLFWLALTL